MWAERGSRDDVCRDSQPYYEIQTQLIETECLSKQPQMRYSMTQVSGTQVSLTGR